MGNRATTAIAEVFDEAAEVLGVVFDVEVDGQIDDRYELPAREMATRCAAVLAGAVGKPNDRFQRTRVWSQVDRGCPSTLGRMRVVCDETNNTPAVVDARAIKVKVFMDGGNVAGVKASVLWPPAYTWFEVTMRPLVVEGVTR